MVLLRSLDGTRGLSQYEQCGAELYQELNALQTLSEA